MALFGTYFINGMLTQTKWPRKQGILQREVINTTILDAATDQMIDWAAGLGAGRPNLALQIIAYYYKDRDWDGSDAPDINAYVEDFRKNLGSTSVAPHDVFSAVKFAKHGTTIPAKGLEDQIWRNAIEMHFMSGLLYGLVESSRYVDWYTSYLKEFEDNRETYKKVGIMDESETLPNLKESYANGEEIVRAYEEDAQIKLPSPPRQLVATIKALRR